jgi:chemotaxis response regulator CheB
MRQRLRDVLITALGMPMPKSIVIVDDSEMIRRKLRELFTRDGNCEICAEAVDGRDAP